MTAPDNNTAATAKANRKNDNGHRLSTRLVLYGSIGLLAMLLVAALMLQSLTQIRHSAEKTLTNLLPAIADQQRTAMNLERLVRFGESVLHSSSPKDRRASRLAFHVLQSDTAFEDNPQLLRTVQKVYGKVENIARLRSRTDELDQRIATLQRNATAELLLLEGEVRRLQTPTQEMPLNETDRLKVRDKLRKMGNLLHSLPATHELEQIFLKRDRYKKLRNALRPLLDRLRDRPDTAQLVGLGKALFPLYAQKIRLSREAQSLWDNARLSLEKALSSISSDSALATASRVRLISDEALMALRMGVVALLTLLVVGIGLHLFAQKDLVKPLMRNVAELERICRQEDDALSVEYTPPETGILEVNAVGQAVKRLHPVMQELNERTAELEKTNTALHKEVAERLRTEQELARAKDQAESAARSKSEFLASMSHEIRTPMNSILGMAELLEETQLTDKQQEYVNMFRSSGELLLGIINDILDISKVESGRLKLENVPFDIRETAARSLNLVSGPARKKGLELKSTVDPEVPRTVTGDPVRLHQILLNLLGNAVKFTEQGTVSLHISQTPEKPEMLLFTVKDSGIGIPGEVQRTIFERFTQADSSTTREYGGTGLGLAICKAFTELMGGRIWMHSLPGRGATFSFTARLPQSTMPEKAKPGTVVRPELPDPDRLRPIRMLLVEDSQNNRLLVEHYLKDWPVKVIHAEHGAQALELFTKQSFDLILMDIQMPVMDGLDATRAIRELEKDDGLQPTPVVALTANAFAEDRERCMRAGCTEYLAKPVKKTELIMTITRLAGTYSVDRNGGV